MRFQRKRSALPNTELLAHLDELPDLYQPINLETQHEKNKKLALARLNLILKRATRKQLQEINSENLLTCSLALLYYYGMRINLGLPNNFNFNFCPKKKFAKVEISFHRTLEVLLPEQSESVIKLSLQFFTELEMWPHEDFIRQLLEVIMYYSGSGTRLFNLILTDLHCVLRGDVRMARHRMRVLYDLLNSQYWVIQKQRLLPFITRLLDFFSLSLNKGDTRITGFRCLRKGFVLCLKRTFERVENCYRLTIIITMLNWLSMVTMNDDELFEFAELLVYAAELYHVVLYNDALGECLLDHVLTNLVGSSHQLYSLIGCRLLQRLFDRQRNVHYLISPAIYYEFSQASGINVGEYDSSDKSFISNYRERLHDAILKAIILHCANITNVKALMALVSCLVLEVPCGLTASAAACLLMAIQDFALNGKDISDTSRFWLHAIVVSVMSLICWVHKAPVLYGYVNQIVSRRAREAPHMNPPLMISYKIASNHVTWNKPTLFFEDWELRYGLWKHFQDVARLLLCVAVLLVLILSMAEGRNKKVVIHVPYKVKKIKHVHTVYKTVHHHHKPGYEHEASHPHHVVANGEEHEHFHHMLMHEDGAQHSQPVPGIGIPEFLPDVPLDVPDMPELALAGRHHIPLYRRAINMNALRGYA